MRSKFNFPASHDLLDHGFVALVDFMGHDKAIVNAARVSYKGLVDNEDRTMSTKDKKLIHSLMKRGHTSPFEAVTFKFAIKAPIFVLRQWQRHRTWSFNEISARYARVKQEFYLPKVEHIGKQMKHEKQMRDMTAINYDATNIRFEMRMQAEIAFSAYNTMLDQGCPRELARATLPQNTYSSMYGVVNLHNLFKFLTLRNDLHAQYEIRVYAEAIEKIIQYIVPEAYEAFKGVKYETGHTPS